MMMASAAQSLPQQWCPSGERRRTIREFAGVVRLTFWLSQSARNAVVTFGSEIAGEALPPAT